MRAHSRDSTRLLRLAFSRLDHHQLVLPRLVPAAKRRRLPVFRGIEAGDALLEARELDDDEAVESLRALEDLIAPAAREHLRAVLREDRRHAVRVLLVFHRIVHFRPGHPVGRHGCSLLRWFYNSLGSRPSGILPCPTRRPIPESQRGFETRSEKARSVWLWQPCSHVCRRLRSRRAKARRRPRMPRPSARSPARWSSWKAMCASTTGTRACAGRNSTTRCTKATASSRETAARCTSTWRTAVTSAFAPTPGCASPITRRKAGRTTSR